MSDPAKKILVVEDHADSLDLLIQALEDDYELASAANGRQALERARELRPHLILMDLSLPVLDGWEATRRLKADVELRMIPVIALTAHAMAGDEGRAREAGCDDYVSKPISPAHLIGKIETWLNCRESNR